MSRQRRGALLLLGAGCLWGTINLFVSILANIGLGPFSIAFVRFSVMTAVLGIFLAACGGGVRVLLGVKPGFVARCMGVGMLCHALANCANNVAVLQVGASVASVLLYTAPVFGCVIACLWFGESIGTNKLAGIALDLFGCLLVVTNGSPGTLLAIGLPVVGLVAGLLNGLVFSLQAPLCRKLFEQVESPLVVTFYCLLGAWLAMAALCFPYRELTTLMSPRLLLVGLLFGLVPSAFAYVLYSLGVASGIETSKVAVLTSTETVVASILGVTVLGEPMGVGKSIGIACVACAVLVMNINASDDEVHGVRVLPLAFDLQKAFAQGDSLAAATNSVNARRERFLTGER